ncbi:phosphotyrosine protein phosphatases superfamily protein, partial [Striga asiatica]
MSKKREKKKKTNKQTNTSLISADQHKIIVFQNPNLLLPDEILPPELLDNPYKLHPLLHRTRHIRQPENGPHDPKLGQGRVQPNRVRLLEQPLHKRQNPLVQLPIPPPEHHLSHQPRHQIARDGNYASTPVIPPRVVTLVIVPTPHDEPVTHVLVDPRVSHTLLHAREIRASGQGPNDARRDILTLGPMWRTLSKWRVKPSREGGVHADGKALLGCMDGLAGRVASGVADDFDRGAEAVDRVADEHDVLVPRHELTLAGGPANDDAFGSALDLHVDERVVRLQVEAAVGE